MLISVRIFASVLHIKSVEMKSTLQANETLVENTSAVGWQQYNPVDDWIDSVEKEKIYRLILSPSHLLSMIILFG